MLTHPNSVPLAREQALQLWGAKQAARERTSGKAPDFCVSFHVRLSHEFSRLLQMESLLTGYHSPSFLNVMPRRLVSRLYTFVLSQRKGCGIVMKADVSYQCGLCSHPTADARVDAIGGSSLLLVLFIALGNFSTGTYNKFHNPTTPRKAGISNVNCHFNLKHTNTC